MARISVDTFFAAMPAWLQTAVRALNIACALCFSALVAWFSLPLIALARSQSAGALDISLAWYRAPTAVGGVLIVATLALRWVYLVKRMPRRRDDAGIDVVDTL